jgi:hypothetical protein
MKFQIYEIGCEEFPKAYIGYTKKENLKQRLYEHRSMFKAREKNKCGTTCHKIFEAVDDVKKVKIKLLEEVETNDKMQAKIRENFHITENKDRLVNKKLGIKITTKTPVKDMEA